MPVTPRSIRRAAASRALSIEKFVRSTNQSPAAIFSTDASLRRDGMWSSGPITMPIRRWPREVRCPYACSTATASSVEMCGKPRSSTPALTMTTGIRRSVSAR
jgi:hypothetical protein